MTPNLHAAQQSHCILQVPFSKPITLIPEKTENQEKSSHSSRHTHPLPDHLYTHTLLPPGTQMNPCSCPVNRPPWISSLLTYSDCSSHSFLAYIINFLLYSESFPLTITCHYFFFLSPLLSPHALLTTTPTSLSFNSKLKSYLFLLSWSLLPYPLECIPVSLPIPPFHQNCYWPRSRLTSTWRNWQSVLTFLTYLQLCQSPSPSVSATLPSFGFQNATRLDFLLPSCCSFMVSDPSSPWLFNIGVPGASILRPVPSFICTPLPMISSNLWSQICRWLSKWLLSPTSLLNSKLIHLTLFSISPPGCLIGISNIIW